LISLITTVFFSLILALHNEVGNGSYIIALIILIVPAILFIMRIVQIPKTKRNLSVNKTEK